MGRKLDDAHRRRLESQEATALKMRVSEDRIKTAIIACKWPVEVRPSPIDLDTCCWMLGLGIFDSQGGCFSSDNGGVRRRLKRLERSIECCCK